MILQISASELTVDGETPTVASAVKFLEQFATTGHLFVSGATVTTQNGYKLFSVSGSDEYTATFNGVDNYWIDEHLVAHVVLGEML